MTYLLSPHQSVSSTSGQPCKVLSFLGGGGQGEVYRALWGNQEVALKWYYEQSATQEQRYALEELVKLGSPSDAFLWPEDIAFERGLSAFGYIMKLRSPRYKSLIDLVAGRIEPSFMTLIDAGINLTKAFRSLHTQGLCYRDISFGNAFFDPDAADVLVCDNDNVTVNRSAVGGVLGTPDFMAPEIVRGEADPSNKTDLYSLAVLLFYLFHIGHPLQGKRILNVRCWDAVARELLFGTRPLFIFDPNDNDNAAVDDIAVDPSGEAGRTPLIYWRLYPASFKNTFTKSFTLGLHDPNSRVTELEWLMSLSSLRNSLFRCEHCATPNFYDVDLARASGGSTAKCWSCGNELQIPFRIRIGSSIVALPIGGKLFPHHIMVGRDFDFTSVLAEVIRHPTDRNILGLKNLTRENWIVTMPDGSLRDAEPGKSVPLVTRAKINFGKVEGELRS